MIDRLSPQPYPLWAVAEDLTGELPPGVQLVIGWTPHPDRDDVLVAVVADPADGTAYRAQPTTGRTVLHLFADHAEAMSAAARFRARTRVVEVPWP